MTDYTQISLASFVVSGQSDGDYSVANNSLWNYDDALGHWIAIGGWVDD